MVEDNRQYPKWFTGEMIKANERKIKCSLWKKTKSEHIFTNFLILRKLIKHQLINFMSGLNKLYT